MEGFEDYNCGDPIPEGIVKVLDGHRQAIEDGEDDRWIEEFVRNRKRERGTKSNGDGGSQSLQILGMEDPVCRTGMGICRS